MPLGGNDRVGGHGRGKEQNERKGACKREGRSHAMWVAEWAQLRIRLAGPQDWSCPLIRQKAGQ